MPVKSTQGSLLNLASSEQSMSSRPAKLVSLANGAKKGVFRLLDLCIAVVFIHMGWEELISTPLPSLG